MNVISPHDRTLSSFYRRYSPNKINLKCSFLKISSIEDFIKLVSFQNPCKSSSSVIKVATAETDPRAIRAAQVLSFSRLPRLRPVTTRATRATDAKSRAR